MISNKEVKRTFKVFLNSGNTNSYSGVQYNANYILDLKKIIFDDQAFDKSYYMYCTFRSVGDTVANNGITAYNIYALRIDFGRGQNTYQYNQAKTPSFIVPVQISLETTPYTYFNLTDNLSQPVFIQNIRNLSSVTVNLIDGLLNTTFVGSGIDNNLRYVCVLTFVEV